MSRSNDAGHFFQTSSALATTERKTAKAKNKRGDPIKLPSKILAAIAAPSGDAVFVAEAAGDVKRVVLETGEIQRIFTEATAPLTCLALAGRTGELFAGSWDKNIYRFDISTKQVSARSPPLRGHADFVKCLLTTSVSGRTVLISGGADAAIVIWDLESGRQLHKLTGHTKALQDLAVDPLSLPDCSAEVREVENFVLFSASSDREIRRWRVGLEAAFELPESVGTPILAHETSVYRLHFDGEGDLWTASADKTAKHLVRGRAWEADTTLVHPDFVRDVVVCEEHGVVVTACRDEEVRVWDLASGELLCTYSGHFEEVTGLVVLGERVVSVSIDGTVRRWGLRRKEMLAYEEEIRKEADGEVESGEKKGENLLTAEEEAELADLMSESE